MNLAQDPRESGPPLGAEVEEGRFSVLCPRFGLQAELQMEVLSGGVRRFSCSISSPDDQTRRRCQAACARWVLGEPS